MGAYESTNVNDKYFGFRVYRIFENGPLYNAGVKELEDFLVPPSEVFAKKIAFIDYIKQNAGKKIELKVYNLVKRHFFTIEITPSVDWCENKDLGYLGASVRYENWFTAHRYLLRVIKVKENTLAHTKLKLSPFDDFLIAIRPEKEDILTLNKDITDPSNLFSNYLHLYKNRPVLFYIYNEKTGARSVKIDLDDKPLGCDVAFGKLHEFPKVRTEEEEGVIKESNEEDNIHSDEKEKLKEELIAENI